jgi:glycosyltransferase involved in cell wall biosynthesis
LPVNLLLVVGSLRFGGTERYMRVLLETLPRDRFRIDLALIEGGSGGWYDDLPEDVHVTVLGTGRVAGTLAVRRLIRQREIEVAYSCDLDSGGLVLFASLLAAPVRRVVGRRGSLPSPTWKQRQGERLVIAAAHVRTTNSHAAVATMAPRLRSGVRVIPNDVDTAALSTLDPVASRQRFDVPEGTPVIGSIGRLDVLKGQDVLLEAFAGVRRSKPDAVLVLVGDGPLRPRLERRRAELGLEGVVHLAGSRADAVDCLPGLDLFVLPSRSESLPTALVEATAHGRTCVACDVGGVGEVVEHGVTGWLCPPEDPHALESSILKALDAPPTGPAAREHTLTAFARERMVDDVTDLLLGAARHRR